MEIVTLRKPGWLMSLLVLYFGKYDGLGYKLFGRFYAEPEFSKPVWCWVEWNDLEFYGQFGFWKWGWAWEFSRWEGELKDYDFFTPPRIIHTRRFRLWRTID